MRIVTRGFGTSSIGQVVTRGFLYEVTTITGSGTLESDSASLSGTSGGYVGFSASINSQDATLEGIGSRVITAIAALAAQYSTLSASGYRQITGSGTLLSGSASIEGYAPGAEPTSRWSTTNVGRTLGAVSLVYSPYNLRRK